MGSPRNQISVRSDWRHVCCVNNESGAVTAEVCLARTTIPLTNATWCARRNCQSELRHCLVCLNQPGFMRSTTTLVVQGTRYCATHAQTGAVGESGESPTSPLQNGTAPSSRMPQAYRQALEIDRLRREGVSDKQVARKLGWTVALVRRHVLLLGLHPELVAELFDPDDCRGDLFLSTALHLIKVPADVHLQIWRGRGMTGLSPHDAKQRVEAYLRSRFI